jgi:hypothetical protein
MVACAYCRTLLAREAPTHLQQLVAASTEELTVVCPRLGLSDVGAAGNEIPLASSPDERLRGILVGPDSAGRLWLRISADDRTLEHRLYRYRLWAADQNLGQTGFLVLQRGTQETYLAHAQFEADALAERLGGSCQTGQVQPADPLQLKAADRGALAASVPSANDPAWAGWRAWANWVDLQVDVLPEESREALRLVQQLLAA